MVLQVYHKMGKRENGGAETVRGVFVAAAGRCAIREGVAQVVVAHDAPMCDRVAQEIGSID